MEKAKILKEPFAFSYTMPSLDWYETITVEIKPEDYCYFRLERRFGPSWWIIGSNHLEKPDYHWEYKEIGRIGNSDLLRFIKWARNENGCKIIEVKAICGSFDIFKEIDSLTQALLKEATANDDK